MTSKDLRAFPAPSYGGEGMTLRQWYAGQALVGLLTQWKPHHAQWFAAEAFELADAMIAKALAKETP